MKKRSKLHTHVHAHMYIYSNIYNQKIIIMFVSLIILRAKYTFLG